MSYTHFEGCRYRVGGKLIGADQILNVGKHLGQSDDGFYQIYSYTERDRFGKIIETDLYATYYPPNSEWPAICPLFDYDLVKIPLNT